MPDTTDETEVLAKLFRKTIHAVNNELMSIVQESELALMKNDPARMREALDFVIDRVMAISRLHRDTRQEIIERTERTGSPEDQDGFLGGTV